jgi:hypothetical protein
MTLNIITFIEAVHGVVDRVLGAAPPPSTTSVDGMGLSLILTGIRVDVSPDERPA